MPTATRPKKKAKKLTQPTGKAPKAQGPTGGGGSSIRAYSYDAEVLKSARRLFYEQNSENPLSYDRPSDV